MSRDGNWVKVKISVGGKLTDEKRFEVEDSVTSAVIGVSERDVYCREMGSGLICFIRKKNFVDSEILSQVKLSVNKDLYIDDTVEKVGVETTDRVKELFPNVVGM